MISAGITGSILCILSSKPIPWAHSQGNCRGLIPRVGTGHTVLSTMFNWLSPESRDRATVSSHEEETASVLHLLSIYTLYF